MYIEAFLHKQKGFFCFEPLQMKYLVLILVFLGLKTAQSQNLTGKWLGELPQTNQAVRFKLELDIVQQGKSLSGTSTFTTLDNHRVVFALTGSVNGRSIILNESSAVSCDCDDGRYEFCMKKMRGTLSIDSLNTLLAIDGTWSSDSSYNGKGYLHSTCPPGRFTIVKPTRLTPLDGYYEKTNIMSARVTPYANLRESDVLFAKRIWREIDLRERANQYLASPNQRLIDVLMKAIDLRQLMTYDATASKEDPNGDSFAKPLTPAQARSRMADSSVVEVIDKNTGEKTGSKVVAGEFLADSVVKFRLKEDWVFDKQRGIFEPRIIGIAPLIKVKTAGDVVNNEYQPAFWIYFPDVRPILATKEVASRNNDNTGLSFDDVFMKRLFNSYIVKQSNDKDERIRDYSQGIDKLYESERIKKSLMDWELNLWEY